MGWVSVEGGGVSGLSVEVRVGAAASAVLEDVARLRIAVFREFPYLYDGDLAYERRYLQRYLDCSRSVLVVARAGATVVGCSTALPLADESEAALRAPLEAAGFPVGEVCYFGESVLLSTYRGQGLGVRFFTEREAHARALGLSWCVFCGVVRPTDHPRRPVGYVPLDAFWYRRGYAPIPVETVYSWKDLDEEEASDKPMRFWGRRLSS